MRALNRQEEIVKGWNIRLKVSRIEEQRIKTKAIEKGLSISEYIKQAALDGLSVNRFSTEGKP